MNIERVSTRAENEVVLKRIEELMDKDPDPKSEDGYELRFLAAICEGYERTIPLEREISDLKAKLERAYDLADSLLDHGKEI